MTTQKQTFCRICEPYCPMLAELNDDGDVVKLKPNPDHPCGGTPCNKGLSWLEVHGDPDRLNFPQKRTNPRTEVEGQFERISWDQAFAEAGEKLRAVRDKYGPTSIAVFFGNPIGFNSRPFVLVGELIKHIGTPMVFNPLSQDYSNKSYAAGEIYGAPTIYPAPDLYHTDYLLCLGGNPKVSHWTLVSVPNDNGKTLKDIKARGGKVRFVNPRRIESSTEETGDTLLIKPGTDVYFLAAILNEICQRGGLRQDLIDAHSTGADEVLDFAAKYPAEKVADITGIPAATIKEVAGEILTAKSAAVYTATGVNQGRQGVLAYWLAEMINFFTGNLGKVGGTYLPEGFCRVDMPSNSANDIAIPTSVGPLANGHGYNPMPATVLPELIENGDIRAAIMICTNPLFSMPAESRLRKAFEKLEVMVATDINPTDTVEMCDYVLPATDWLEREDINFFCNGMQLRPYVQHTEAMVAPKFERRDDWWILCKLGLEMGPSELFETEIKANGFATFNQLLATKGLSIDQLRELPQRTAMIEQPPKEEFFTRGVLHPDGKIHCAPPIFAEAGLYARCDEIFAELTAESPDALKLVSMRTIHMHNSWLANMPKFRRGILAENPLNICEADAVRLGLHEGDAIRVYNEYGSIETRVLLNNDLRPGAVAMTHGYGHKTASRLRVASTKPGANVNDLMPSGADTHEPLSYMSWMTGVPVQIERQDKGLGH